MRIYDENFRFSEEANRLSDEIGGVLGPIFDRCMKEGISPGEFYYLVGAEVHEMIMMKILVKWDK